MSEKAAATAASWTIASVDLPLSTASSTDTSNLRRWNVLRDGEAGRLYERES